MTIDKERVHVGKKIRSIAIIGGGASGAIALDSLVQEGTFDKITLFERRAKGGGVWVLDTKPDKLDVPPGVSQQILDPSLRVPELTTKTEVLQKRPSQQRYTHTASYQGLRTNIPEQLMTFSDDKHWGELPGERVDDHFVRGVAIQRYIERYLNRHSENIVFSTTVEKVDKDYSQPSSPFVLTLRTETDQKDEDGTPLDRWWTEQFDSVVVAVGHYHVPYIPNVPGLDEVYKRFPGLVQHSKTFRDAESELKDKNVVVIGTRSSGADIVELGSQFAKKIYHSQRGKNLLRKNSATNIELKPVIIKFEITKSGDIVVHFANDTTVINPDLIYYATGFRFSYPFLNDTYGSHFTTGTTVPDLYLHTFYTKDPLLTFVGVPTDAISLRAFEYQAVLVSRFLAGKTSIPSRDDQIIWCLNRFREKGDTRAFHTIDWGSKLEYLESLVDIGGGYDRLGEKGRPFPKFTEEDIQLHKSIQQRLLEFFSVNESEISGVTVQSVSHS
ncbi:CYFA0S33e00650g1_1 [Cyberlindnera fabianii]|uniref:CYFA0S33e00650g1_1 n=1 Tax=Cyberlindnera fabianii TaxID=36022 RepID=A0A061BCB7_CYBFA|nr:CYFA0S33e00650g1_1 [Cyberlindnera fabianii]